MLPLAMVNYETEIPAEMLEMLDRMPGLMAHWTRLCLPMVGWSSLKLLPALLHHLVSHYRQYCRLDLPHNRSLLIFARWQRHPDADYYSSSLVFCAMHVYRRTQSVCK